MCFNDTNPRKYTFKCNVVAVISLVIHTILLFLSISAMAIKFSYDQRFDYQANSNYKNINWYLITINPHIFFGVTGISATLGVFGIFSTIMLIIGIRYNKPGYVALFLCYSLQLNIVLLISGLLCFMKIHWSIGVVMTSLSVTTAYIVLLVYGAYESIVQDALLQVQTSISDLTLLIDDNLSEDEAPNPTTG